MGHDLREIGNVVFMFPRGEPQLWDFHLLFLGEDGVTT